MKKLFFIMGCVLLVALSTSCAKDCKCTYFEDGKKIAISSTAQQGAKYYDKAECEMQSEREYETTVCKVNCYNEVGPEPDYTNQEAYQAWREAINDCKTKKKKKVKAKVECKLQ
jgi:hypothetical protein